MSYADYEMRSREHKMGHVTEETDGNGNDMVARMGYSQQLSVSQLSRESGGGETPSDSEDRRSSGSLA